MYEIIFRVLARVKVNKYVSCFFIYLFFSFFDTCPIVRAELIIIMCRADSR